MLPTPPKPSAALFASIVSLAMVALVVVGCAATASSQSSTPVTRSASLAVAAPAREPTRAIPSPTATPLPPTATPLPPTPTPVPPTPTPLPPTATPTPYVPVSWFADTTIVGYYGRAFGVAPILGRLGEYANVDAMARSLPQFTDQIQKVNGGKKIVPEIHLIYALAMPCESASDKCLLYLEAQDPHIVDDYIKPAAARGWLVVLDDQLGNSTPVAEVQRMIDQGYLKYDNVEVALDPEFHVYPGDATPGIPIGVIQASQVNAAQQLLDNYVEKEHLAHRKILIVHQFGDKNVNDGVPFMIQNKEAVRDYANVDLVIDVDGFGDPDTKVVKYNKITDGKLYPFIHYRGIKVFPRSPYEHAGHYDKPMLTWRQVFGLDPSPGGARVQVPPDLVIIN